MGNSEKKVENNSHLVEAISPQQVDPYTGQTQLFDKIMTSDEFSLEPNQRIYPRPNSLLYEEIIQSLFANKCYDVESGEILNCKIRQYKITGYITANEKFCRHKQRKSIVDLFQLLCAIVVEHYYDGNKKQIKFVNPNDWIDVEYSLIEKHNILQHNKNKNKKNDRIKSRLVTIFNYYNIIKTIVLAIFNCENEKEKITGQALFGSIEMHRSFFRFKIEAPYVGKVYGQSQTIWDVLITGYVGLLFAFSFKLKTAEAKSLVNYCAFTLRTNADKDTVAVKYDTLWEKIVGDTIQSTIMHNPHTNKMTRYSLNGTTLTQEKGKNCCGDFLDLLIEEINATQEEECPINPEDETNNTIDYYLKLENNREAEELIIKAGPRTRWVLQSFASGRETGRRKKRLSHSKAK